MAFVKLDCGILDSTLWIDRCARELFITALLMAEPFELTEPVQQINVRDLDTTDFVVPPGWYGFVSAAGTGIIHRCGMDQESGMTALERLGQPEKESRTPRFEGRRMIRVDGGYIILNYDLYRNKDHTAAERSRRYRERKAASRVTPRSPRVASRSVTQAEAEAYNLPPNPLKGAVGSKFEEWKKFRRGIGKKPKDWDAMFSEQAKWLLQFPESTQLEIISSSIRNGYQGLFEPKNNGTHKRHSTESNRSRGTANEGKSAQYAGVGKV